MIQFRARSLMAFVLTPEPPFTAWLAELDRSTANSPGFFSGRPVMLDLSAGADLRDGRWLVSELANRNIKLIGIEGTETELGMGYPPIIRAPGKASVRDVAAPAPAPAPAPAGEPGAAATLLIESPVRSGQSIVHADGDVVVMGSVGSGSEILAGGSIHIYGTLRGRAMAGAMGNEAARIFCTRNEAELLAINGYYCTAEQMDAGIRGKPGQAFLRHGALVVTPLE